jgi:hypothetical protein
MFVKLFVSAPGTFETMQQSSIRYVHACIDSGGGYFDNLLWIMIA